MGKRDADLYVRGMTRADVPTVLITGDTAEARALAAAWPGACRVERVSVQAALAGAAACVAAEHPCDPRAADTVRHARAAGVAVLRLCRPGWHPRGARRWHVLRRASDLTRTIPPGAHVFAATGREEEAVLRRLRATVYLRRRGGRDAPPGLIAVEGTPPFTIADEMRLFRELGIGWLVLRDAGGEGARPKLDAARALGLHIALIARPALPDAPVARTSKEALRWLRQTLPSDA